MLNYCLKTVFLSAARESKVEYKPSNRLNLPGVSAAMRALTASEVLSAFMNPLSTQRNSPPEAYCVMPARVSPA